jgi:hypothetical protein
MISNSRFIKPNLPIKPHNVKVSRWGVDSKKEMLLLNIKRCDEPQEIEGNPTSLCSQVSCGGND